MKRSTSTPAKNEVLVELALSDEIVEDSMIEGTLTGESVCRLTARTHHLDREQDLPESR